MVALCICFGVAALVFVQRFVEAALERELANTLSRGALVLERFTEMRYSVLRNQARALAQAPHLRAVVDIPEVDDATVLYTVEQLFAALDSELMLVLDRDGDLLADVSEAGRFGDDLRALPGVGAGLVGEEFVGVWSYHEQLYHVALTPITLGAQILGLRVLGHLIDVEAADEIRQYTGQDALILYHDNPVVYSGESVVQELGMNFTEHLSGGSADLFETSISGRACLATALPLAIDEGYVVLFSPLEEIEADISRMNLWILAAGAIALALAVLASLRISSSVSGRFQELAHSMVRVSQDDYGVRIADVGEDEVTILVRGFNEMLDEIQNRDTALNRVLQERGVAAEGDPPPRQEQPADHLQPPEPPGQQALGQRGRRRLRGEPRPHRFHGPGP